GVLTLEGGQKFVAVHAWHLDVEQNDVRHFVSAVQDIKSVQAVLGCHRLPPRVLNQIRYDPAYTRRVVHDHHRQGGIGVRDRLQRAAGDGLACRLAEQVCGVDDQDHSAIAHQGCTHDAVQLPDVTSAVLQNQLTAAKELIDDQGNLLVLYVQNQHRR